jgi:hypothetical protein
MVLMYAVLNVATPTGCSADLIGAPVAFNHQKVADAKPEFLKLTIE